MNGMRKSQSSAIFTDFGLHRENIRKFTRYPSSDGMLQTTFGNLLGAARFKAVMAKELR